MKTTKKKRFLFALIGCILCMNTSVSINAVTYNTANNTKTQISSISNQKKTEEKNWPKGPSVTASSAIVMDASTGLILYEKNIHDKHYPASITKILTSLIAIENSSLSDVVTFSKDAVFEVDLDSSRVGIDVDEELTMEQCLYAVLLSSANEVSYAVAEHVGGSVDKFVAMMNERAKELGCSNTNFVNPHGLHDRNHYTSAYDMALIAQEAIKNTTFAKITGSRTYVIPPTNIQEEERPLANHHKFIKRDIHYDGCVGGKTGYTSNAKFTLVTYAKRGDMQLISVIMESDTGSSQYSDTKALLDYGFDNFSITKISNIDTKQTLEESPFFTKYSSVYDKNNSRLMTDTNGYIILPNDVTYAQAQKQVHFKPVKALSKGDNIIGSITYTYHNKTVGKTNIIYRNTEFEQLPIKKLTPMNGSSPLLNPNTEDSSSKTKRNLKPFIITVTILILIVLGLLYYYLIERPHRRRKRAYYRRRERRRQQYLDDYYDL